MANELGNILSVGCSRRNDSGSFSFAVRDLPGGLSLKSSSSWLCDIPNNCGTS
jgi:hypothetical protein